MTLPSEKIRRKKTWRAEDRKKKKEREKKRNIKEK